MHGARDGDADAVEGDAAGFGFVEDTAVDRGYCGQYGRRGLFHGLEDEVHVYGGEEDEAGLADGGDGLSEGHAVGVEEGEHGVDDFVIAGADIGFAHKAVGFEVAVGEHDALGEPSGTRGVLEEGEVVGGGAVVVGGDGLVFHEGAPGGCTAGGAFEFCAGGFEFADGEFEGGAHVEGHLFDHVDRVDVFGADVLGEAGDVVCDFVPDDGGFCTVVFEHVAEFGGGVKGVVFYDDGAEAHDGVEGDDVLGAVGQDDGDAVAVLYTGFAEAFCDAEDLVAEFGVGGGGSEEFEGYLVGCLADGFCHEMAEGGFGQVDVDGGACGVVALPGAVGEGEVVCVCEVLG